MNFKNENKILLILDIDETLVHATSEKLERDADFEIFGYYVYCRPFLRQFLEDIKDHFLIAVWSSASDDYVKEVVETIFPKNYKLEFVWGRTRCKPKRFLNTDLYGNYNSRYQDHYNFIKPLKKLKRKGFTMDKILIVDDTPHKSSENFGNAIYPEEYSGSLADDELKKLARYLITLKDKNNVRNIEKRNWKAKAL